jgi:hypothetical protein
MPFRALPLFPTSLTWGGNWTPVPNDPFTPQELKTDVGLAAAAFDFSDDPLGGIGYTYQIALALVNQQGQVFVNLLSRYPVPGNWTKWIDISGEFQSANVALSAVAIGKKLYLYAVGVDTHVYFNWTDGQSWNGWTPVSGVEKTKIAVSAASDGTLYLVGLSGGVWANPHPTTPDGEWKLVPPVVQPVFQTDAGICVSAGNSRSSVQNGIASFDLLCKRSGHQAIYYLYPPQAPAWSALPGGGLTNVAITSVPIIFAGGNPGCSFLFLTGRGTEVFCSGAYVPDAGSDNIFIPPSLNWETLEGIKTDAPLAAAVAKVETGGPEGISQRVFVFARGVGSFEGSVQMNSAWVSIGHPGSGRLGSAGTAGKLGQGQVSVTKGTFKGEQ